MRSTVAASRAWAARHSSMAAAGSASKLLVTILSLLRTVNHLLSAIQSAQLVFEQNSTTNAALARAPEALAQVWDNAN